jgi:hypothetical protein
LLSHHQNVGQNHDIKIVKRSFENVAQFRHLGTTATNQNLNQSRNFCLLNRCLNKYKLEHTKLQYLPVVLYGCETCSSSLREERRLRVYEIRVPRRIFGLKRDQLRGGHRIRTSEEIL